MTILKQIEDRRALRALDARPIGKDVLARLIQAAHLAPFLVQRGMLYFAQVVYLIKESKDEILRNLSLIHI